MSVQIPAGYETDEDDYDDYYSGSGSASNQHVSSSFQNSSNAKYVPSWGNNTTSDAPNEEPIDWQSAIQSSMNDSKANKTNDLNDTTLHSANSKLQDTTLLGDNTNGNGKQATTNTYNPFDEFKIADGPIDLEKMADRDLPDEDVPDDQSLPPYGTAKNLKIYGDLELFLCYIKEDDLIDLFDKHEVTFRQLLTCNEQDLINIGIDKVGIRKKILEALSQVHARKWEPTSITDLTAQDLYTSPGIYLVLSDIKKHLEYIRDTVSHLKTKIQSDPEIMELGKDFVGIKKITQESMELVEANKELLDETKNFATYIKTKQLDLPRLAPANHIDLNYITEKPSSRVAGYTLGAAILLASLVALKLAWR